MTKIEIIKKAIILNEEEKLKLKIKRQRVEESRTDELSRMIHEYFEEVLEEEDTIKVSSDRVEFTRPQEGYKYNKELLNLYFNSKGWGDEEADRIETSFYSTSENSEYELRRMILIGKVGQVVLDFQDDIIAEYNLVRANFKNKLSEFNKEIWALEKKAGEMRSEIDTIEKENILSKVESEGIKFELPEGKSVYELPNMGVKFNWTINNVKEIKVLNKTASGKSADVELKVMHNVYNADTQSHMIKEQTQLLEKVRMVNIESFLLNNTKRISAS